LSHFERAPNVPLDAWSLSNSVVRLKVEKRSATGDPPRGNEPYTLRMNVRDYFTPYRKILGDCRDLDLGSSGPLLIPGTPFIVSGGKEGIVYVLDRFQMGGYDKAGPPWDFASISSMFSSYIRVPRLSGPPTYVPVAVPFSRIPADDRKRDHGGGDRHHQDAGAGSHTTSVRCKVPRARCPAPNVSSAIVEDRPGDRRREARSKCRPSPTESDRRCRPPGR